MIFPIFIMPLELISFLSSDSMKESKGGGVGSEIIDVIELSIPEVKKILFSFDAADGFPHTSPGMRLAMSWFVYEKYPQLSQSK